MRIKLSRLPDHGRTNMKGGGADQTWVQLVPMQLYMKVQLGGENSLQNHASHGVYSLQEF